MICVCGEFSNSGYRQHYKRLEIRLSARIGFSIIYFRDSFVISNLINTNKLNGKVAVITGGTSGIGKATAIDFIENGGKVIITGRHQETIDETVKYLGPQSNGFVSDAGKFSGLMDLRNKIEQFSSHVDILFVNAGYVNYAPIELIDEDHYNSQFNVIVKETLFTVKQILPLMQEGSGITL